MSSLRSITILLISLLAVQPRVHAATQPFMGQCVAPPVPTAQYLKYHSEDYKLALKNYEECLAERASRYAAEAKSSVDDAADRAERISDKVKGWFR